MKDALAGARQIAGAILTGAAILIAGIAPWSLLAPINARIAPEIPWAGLATIAWIALMLVWLNGAGWPQSNAESRRFRLRWKRPASDAWSAERRGPTLLLIAVLTLLYVLWILMGGPATPPDMSPYPTTAYRISVVVTGALVSGIVEEAAFRGYMQTGLERFGAGPAILITSLIFALFHGVHGWQALLLMGPGLFIASVLYGMLAYHTGSIVPGMIMHVLGDLSFTLFATLRGDFSVLIAP